jgi:hypothetical protein
MNMKTHIEPDLNTAAFILATGHKFLGLVHVRAGRYGFEFEDADDKASGASLEYLQGATVRAKSFAAAISDLKSRLYSHLENEHGKQYER